MIIQLSTDIDKGSLELVLSRIQEIGYKATEVNTQKGGYLVCIGKKDFDIRAVGNLKGVQDIHRVSDDYKLVSRKWKVNPTVIDLGDGVKITEGDLAEFSYP